MLLGVLDIVKDLAIVVAAIAGAAVAWEWLKSAQSRGETAAKALTLAGERASEAREIAARLQSHAAAVAQYIDASRAKQSEKEVRILVQVRVHAMLQATRDPFLTFDEIERALAAEPTIDGPAVAPPPACRGPELRRVLMAMVRDRVIAQLDRDRYFIASDFETDEAQDGRGPVE